MINKNLMAISLVLAASMSSIAVASDSNANATVSVASDYIYRGVDVTGSQGTLGLGLSFDDVVFNGVFLNGNFNTIEATPFNGNTSVRSDLEVGYGNTAYGVDYSVSLARVVNPVSYTADYTEVRVRGSYGPVYAEVGHGLTANVNRDTYFGVGVEGEVLYPNLTVGALASVVSYDTFSGLSDTRFNNLEVYASYPVVRDLTVNAGYSYGGESVVADFSNHAWVGVSYTF